MRFSSNSSVLHLAIALHTELFMCVVVCLCVVETCDHLIKKFRLRDMCFLSEKRPCWPSPNRAW